MPIIANSDDFAVEKSTYSVDVTFKDEDEELVTPDTATWTLTDDDGTVINSLSQEIVSPLDSIVTIVLSGDDLAFQENESGDAEWRILTIEATYTSDLGPGLPLKESFRFALKNLIAVT